MVEDRSALGVCEQVEVQVVAGSMGEIWREAMRRGSGWWDGSPVVEAMACESVGEFEQRLRPTLLSLL